jgi:hypothetical protein
VEDPSSQIYVAKRRHVTVFQKQEDESAVNLSFKKNI